MGDGLLTAANSAVTVLGDAGDTSTMITTALTTLTSVATTLINYALENPMLAILFVGGTIVPVGFALFKQARHSVS